MSPGETSMGKGRDSRVRDLFKCAVELQGEARMTFLRDARASDPDAVTEVEELLRFHDDDSKILDRPVVEAAARVIGGEDLPKTIGSYRVLREIGSGGMGVVYEGEQDFPHRRVALKVVRPELVTGSLLKRFTHEAEALSLLRHPGIAQLYEAGFADGERRRRPFMAMELVEGKPLSAFVRERSLSPRERLSLMALVCDAVDHAHKRGVIHRDLKPGNILVGNDGQPKVLDFGIARLTAVDAGNATVATSVGQIIGTVGYMSPEQFSGDPGAVDARSDVYALGVMLYELLAGRPPVDVGTMTLAAAATAVQRSEPALLGVYSRELRGDVESIAAKALEKDPVQRYQSAAEFGADIRRSLNNEPVLAHPQTAWYQARKFAQRNKVLVALGMGVVVALAAGVVGTAWQAVSATRASHRADVQAQISRQRADFLTGIIKAATPEVAGGRETTVREMLDKASESLEGSPDLDPMVLADTHQLLAEAYTSLGLPLKTQEHAARALELHTRLLGATHESTIKDERLGAGALSRRERNAEAVAALDPLLVRARAALGGDHPETLAVHSALAAALAGSREYAARAPAEYDEVWRASVRLFGKDDPRTLSARLGQAFAAHALGETAEAETISKEVMDARAALRGEDHYETIVAGHLWVSTLNAQRKSDEYDRAAPVLYERAKRVMGEQHTVTVSIAASLSDHWRSRGRFAEALPLARAAVASYESRIGPEGMYTVMQRYGLIQCLLGTHQLDEAASVLGRQQEIVDRKYEEGGYMAAVTAVQQVWLARERGDAAGVEEWSARLRGTQYETMLEEGKVDEEHSMEAPRGK